MKLAPRFSVALVGSIAVVVVSLTTWSQAADAPRALPPGTQPDDHRLGALRHLDNYFPFTPVASKEAWARRAAELRRQARVATGLWPMPERTPLNAVIHGKIDRHNYTVEKVIFESFPGHYVTGSLYRPKGRSGRLPVVMNPHGHWPNGRFYEIDEAGVRREIASGAERFEVGGRYPLQMRPATLARMGCIAFFYDMEGYADSVQLTDAAGVVQHRPGVREHMNTKENWGLFSPQAELRMQNIMGLQTWNSVRALDFITTLPDVDPAKIAVTGASGGGTQTFMIAAVDDRPAVMVPAVMVSTAMQGGCTCENAPYLRVGAGNIDLAAIPAPKPLSLIAAKDWTVDIMTKGFPDLKNLYGMLGAPDRVEAHAFVHFGHNYNGISRMAMYNFVNRHFSLGLPEPVIERDIVPLTRAELSVWDSSHPAPSGDKVGEAHERELVRQMTATSSKVIDALAPKDAATLAEYKRVVGGGWDVLIGRRLEDVGTVKWDLKDKQDKGSYLLMTGLVTREGQPPSPLFTETNRNGREQLPALSLHPKEGWNGQVVVWVGENGKADVLGPDGNPAPPVANLLEAKFSVLAADLLQQGEFTADGKPAPEQRVQPWGDGSQPWMKSAVYTFGYNRPLFSLRVNDVLTLIRFVQTDEHAAKQVHLVGLGPTAGPIVAAARAQSGDAVVKAAIDTGGFRFASLDKFTHPMFTPGAVKYQDVPGLLALGAPGKTWVAGEGVTDAAKESYAAGGQPAALVLAPQGGAADAAAAVEWLKQP